MRLAFAALATIAVLSAGPAWAFNSAPFENHCLPVYAGRASAPYNQGFCQGYLLASYNALVSVHKVCAGGNPATLRQLKLIMDRWTLAHPEQLNRPFPATMRNALIAAFPCQ